MEKIREIEMEWTLAWISDCENSRSRVYTFGVIIDASEPFEGNGIHKAGIKLKIIDPTFNCETVIPNE